jgi:hypothetical protein
LKTIEVQHGKAIFTSLMLAKTRRIIGKQPKPVAGDFEAE